MPALTNRNASRERLRKMFEEQLEKFIPQDESVPLQGSTFEIFETQAEECGLPLMAAMMEERSKLDSQALVEQGGRCPHCRSERVYLRSEKPEEERQSAYGPLRLRKQRCRCRACGKTFSPAGS